MAAARRWRPTLGQAATGLVLLPLVVSAADLIFGVGGAYQATSDRAGLEVLSGDVGHHNPLIGPFSRDGWHHPGPMIYYLFALPLRLVGHRSIGLSLGALAINAASIVGVAVLARRRGGTPLLLCTLVVVALLMRALGPEFVRDQWNPYVVVLPFLLLAFLTWSLMCGDRWALPLAVVVGSFIAQTHIGYGAVAVPLVGWGVGWLVVSAIRDHRAGALVRPALVAVAAGGLLWLPVAIEQRIEDPGNLTLIRRYLADPPDELHSLADGAQVVLSQFEAAPEWLAGTRDAHPFTGEHRAITSLALPVLVAAVVAAAIFLWRRTEGMARLTGLLGVMAVTGVVSVARTSGPAFPYRLYWSWAVGAVAGVLVLRAVWELAVLVGPRRAGRWAGVALVVAAAALSAVNGVESATADPPEPRRSAAMRTIVPQVVRELQDRPEPVLLDADSFGASQYVPGLVRQLERRGIAARVPYEALGEHRRVDGRPPTRLRVAVDAEVEAFGDRDDLDLVAYWGDVSIGERAAVTRRLSRSAPETLLDPTSPEFAAAKRLGEAVAVFAERD